MKDLIKQNPLEIINTCIEKKAFDELKTILEHGKFSLEETEQNWDNSPLVKLIESGIDSDKKVELFKELAEKGARLNVKNSELNWNLLHYLIKLPEMSLESREINNFEKELIRELVNKQPLLVDEMDVTGETPLDFVDFKSGDEQVILALLSAGNLEEKQVYKISSEIFKSIISGNNSQRYKEILTLLREGNKLGFYKAMHENKMQILDMAIENNDFAFLENALVGSELGPLNYFTKEQLSSSIWKSYEELLSFFSEDKLQQDIKREIESSDNIVKKAIIGFYDRNKNNQTWVNFPDLLWREIFFGNTQEFMSLVERGADIKSEKLLLSRAAEKGYEAICLLLIKNGVDVNVKGDGGTTPLHKVAMKGDKEICKLLIKEGADVNVKDEMGRTPLHYAVKTRNYNLCYYLISEGADVNIRDKKGKTPLGCAIENGDKKMCEFLISNGADVNLPTTYQQGGMVPASPLNVAAYCGDLEISKLLLKNGATSDRGNVDGLLRTINCINTKTPEMQQLKRDVSNIIKHGGENTFRAKISNLIDYVYDYLSNLVSKVFGGESKKQR